MSVGTQNAHCEQAGDWSGSRAVRTAYPFPCTLICFIHLVDQLLHIESYIDCSAARVHTLLSALASAVSWVPERVTSQSAYLLPNAISIDVGRKAVHGFFKRSSFGYVCKGKYTLFRGSPSHCPQYRGSNICYCAKSTTLGGIPAYHAVFLNQLARCPFYRVGRPKWLQNVRLDKGEGVLAPDAQSITGQACQRKRPRKSCQAFKCVEYSILRHRPCAGLLASDTRCNAIQTLQRKRPRHFCQIRHENKYGRL